MEWLLKEKYNGKKSEAFFTDCKRLALGEPLAYVIGWTPFLNCKIWLDNHPLIPRLETEFWIEELIKTIHGSRTISLGIESGPLKILDLCAGSGCIGIALAMEITASQVDFGEIDQKLLPTISKNLAENLPEDNKHQVIHTNLFSGITGKYDFIACNPPYIDENLDRTDQSVKDHEPFIALFGGSQGMELITKIILQSPLHLADGGQLWLEHEPEQEKLIKELADEVGFTCQSFKDQFKVIRYSSLVLQ